MTDKERAVIAAAIRWNEVTPREADGGVSCDSKLMSAVEALLNAATLKQWGAKLASYETAAPLVESKRWSPMDFEVACREAEGPELQGKTVELPVYAIRELLGTLDWLRRERDALEAETVDNDD